MLSTILGILSSGLSLALTILGMIKAGNEQETGQIKLIVEILAKAKADLDQARAIKANIDSTIINDPGSVRKPDDFTVPK